jgi:hypothetical protein
METGLFFLFKVGEGTGKKKKKKFTVKLFLADMGGGGVGTSLFF